MEDRSYDPNERKEESQDPTKRFMQKGESFIQFLLRKRESDSAESLEDEDDEESEEAGASPKKRSKLFRSVFRNLVTKQPIYTNQENTSIQTHKAESDFTPSIDVTDKLEAGDASTSTVESSAPDLLLDSERNIATPDRSPNNSLEPNTLESVAPDGDSESTRTGRPDIELSQYEEAQNVSNQPHESRQAPIAPRLERETVIERSVGNALPVVLVGAEYFARKRADRKLDQKFTSQNTELSQGLSQGDRARQELDRLVQQNRTEVESLKQKRDSLPEGTLKFNQPEVRQPVSAERQSPPMQEVSRSQEVALLAKQETAERNNRAPTVAETQERFISKSPEKPAKSIEQVQERSHEIKDEQTVATAATTIGAIIADSTAAQSLMLKQTSNQQYKNSPVLPNLADEQASKLYRHAVQTGFTLAVVIIILGLLAYLVLQ